MRISNFFYFGFFCPAIFLISYYFIVPVFIEDDSKYYILFYESLSNEYAGWENVFLASKYHIDTLEPGYPLLAKIFSALGFSQFFFSSAINFLFFISLGVFGSRLKINLFFLITLVFSSYYFLIMLTGLDRLKLSFVFLLLSLSFVNRLGLFFVFFCLAAMVHAQIAILAFPFIVVYFKGDIVRFFYNGSFNIINLFFFLCVFLVFSFVGFFLFDHVAMKFNSYNTSLFFGDFFKSVIFTAVSLLFLSNKRFKYFVFSFFICVCVIFVSSDRLNIMLYFIAIYFMLFDNKIYSKVFLAFMFLFWGWKGLRLVFVAYGNGGWGGLV